MSWMESMGQRLDAMRADVSVIRAEVAGLRAELEDLKRGVAALTPQSTARPAKASTARDTTPGTAKTSA